MRALLVLIVLAPSWTAAEPCEKLITAICPDKVKRTKCVEFVAERIVMANEKALTTEGRAKWCADTLADEGKVEEMSGFLLYTDTVPVEVKVKVKPVKADSRSWDAGGALPDVAACFTVDRETSCVPAGKAPKRVKKALCPDSLACTLKLEARRSAQVQIQIVDVDAMANDTIGTCLLTVGKAGIECSGQVSARFVD